MHWHRRLCVYIFVHTYLPIYTHILILFFDSYLCICIFVLPCAVTVMFMYAQMCIHINFLYTYTHLCVRVCVCDAFVCMKTCMHMLVYVRRTHTHARTHMRAHSSCCKVQRRLNKSITPWLCTTFVVALLTSKRRTASYGQPIALGYLCDYRKPFILLH